MNMEDKLAEVMEELRGEMNCLDRDTPEEDRYNKLEEVLTKLTEAYNDLTEII